MSKLNQIDRPQDEDSSTTAYKSPSIDKNPEVTVTPNPLLKDVPAKIIKQAWFIMAHLVLEKGARVLNMRAGDGAVTYAMAALNPDLEFIGIDLSEDKIKKAKKNYELPNLQFISSDIHKNFIPKESVDAIVNSFNLHNIYSENNCSEKAIIETLDRQFSLLKKDGYIFTQGYIIPSGGGYVLIEMPNEPSVGQGIEGLSEIELLILYSESARPRENDSYRGFYLEEIPARFPRTRLFRVPEKWAYEFILRKDNRTEWDNELYKEYTFFNRSEFNRAIRNFGARLLYSAPHWDEERIKNRYNKKMRLFTEGGEVLGTPETSFVMLAQKTQERQSLTLEERRPSKTENPSLRITAVRNEYDGKVSDIVSRDMHITEILPYRVTSNNKLNVFVHEGIPRCLANTIPRKGSNIDGKQWSGHMTETFAVPQEIVENLDKEHFRSTLNFAQNYLGLKPEMNCFFEKGPGFFPAPDCIDEHVETLYLHVKKPEKHISPNIILEDASGFSTKGRIREINAQEILNAIGVGLIPTSRLEIQILGLYQKLGLDYQAWANCPLSLKTEEPQKTTKLQEILANLAEHDTRFKETKGTTGKIKTMQSIFVDEGQNDSGIAGLASQEKDFVLNEEKSMNTAVVLPLTRKINGEVMAGIVEEYLPVPQRYKGNGYTVSCPSFSLPESITNFDMARKFIAEKFEVPIDCVARMGESYFSHIGITPQRIYPFAVSTAGASGWKKVGRGHGTTSFTPLYRLYRLLYLDNYDSFMKITAMAYQSTLGQNSDLSATMSFSQKQSDQKSDFMQKENIFPPYLPAAKKYNHDQ